MGRRGGRSEHRERFMTLVVDGPASGESVGDFLRELRREVDEHRAVNHPFLTRLATSPFSREDYGVVAENHYSMVRVFTHYLERLLIRAPEGGSKLWLAKVLV